ncbi:hypothetical protein CMQ_1659 [Grosmannia clavigera kw1407]|uniref:Borealin N-terminal domain-containing protein n=1 Tax=Grosmannia clavigera (strain kw1407 / UAMH 11150) TaxID=655863 RepID=F0XC88_GROCL|nr:uncharacterized protein CMQ_1659 [Grosmannia clavigera kw1407]EFX04731.1 hypothetical protein CMQ_1659 [Grosmannia clavigera kw1407]
MPPRGRKRKSDQSIASETQHTPDLVGQKIATKTDSPAVSPSKRRRTGITVSQKQALIDNLQLEVTERARKLRAQYNLQAQGLRTRIEIRVNRIPMALRKLKVGDLLLKHSAGQSKPLAPKQLVASMADRVPPSALEKDYHAARPANRVQPSPWTAYAAPGRPPKRLSDNLVSGDKENRNAHFDGAKKWPRTNHHQQGAAAGAPPQVLSPASSNSRINPRDRELGAVAPSSPIKSYIARPVSPEKQAAATTLLSSMVEKARSNRVASDSRKPAAASSSVNSTTSARIVRRASGTSESSDASTSTVVRKAGKGRAVGTTAAATVRKVPSTTSVATAALSTKKSVMGSIRKGVASAASKRGAASKAAAAAATTTRSGRILRKRD